MGKCKFNDLWLQDEQFNAWLKPVEGNTYEAHCTLCKKTFKLGTLGIKALESHCKSEKHKAVIKWQQQTLSISHYCSTSGAGASRSSVTQSAAVNTFIYFESYSRPPIFLQVFVLFCQYRCEMALKLYSLWSKKKVLLKPAETL